MKKIIIAGGGLASIILANQLAGSAEVSIVTKGKFTEGNSWRAQGGISFPLLQEDSEISHLEDTLKAGCYQNDVSMAKMMVNKGRLYIKKLTEELTVFDRYKAGTFILGKEAAHSYPRILHAGGDQTGKKLMQSLYKKLHTEVTLEENVMMQDLLIEDNMCRGVIIRDKWNRVHWRRADAVVIASGGIGGIFASTTNDKNTTGDGLAMAWRAGVQLKDLEYIQFHPTLLNAASEEPVLISEAVRGEGAVLVLEDGRRIMKGIPGEDLAARDIVAREVSAHTQAGKKVYLDITMIDRFSERFPQVTALCRAAGIAVEQGRLPVTAGAHFHMGGVKTDRNGQTSIAGLYAVGEAACTGVHGANRLASNSLLEAIVFAKQAAAAILKMNQPVSSFTTRSTASFFSLPIKRENKLPEKKEIKQKISRALGVVRNERNLKELITWTAPYALSSSITSSMEEEEKRNMLTSAYITAVAALANETSIGAHFRADKHPVKEEQEHESIVFEGPIKDFF